MCKVLEKVLEMITPKENIKAHLSALVRKFITEVKDIVRKYDIPASVELHGSFARDTWLADKRDADVFILFNQILSKDEILEVLEIFERELKYKTERAYAQHPYLRVKISDDFTVDLVPGFRVGKILSAVDRTPLHSEYLKKRLTDELKGEIRLLKAFLKGINAYGAEIKVEGLSGYACELLTLYYGSFIRVLEALAENRRIFIDFSNSWDKKSAFKKFDNPIVLIDPVDPNRNATAALSWGTFNRISLAAIYFLSEPTINFFKPRITEYHKRLARFYLSVFPNIVIKLRKKVLIPEDIYWGQAKRIHRDIVNFIRNQKYFVATSTIIESYDKIYIILFVLNKDKKFDFRIGPPLSAKENVKSFIKRWANEGLGPIISESRRLSYIIPTSKRIEELLDNFLKNVKKDPSFESLNIISAESIELDNTAVRDFLLSTNPLSIWFSK